MIKTFIYVYIRIKYNDQVELYKIRAFETSFVAEILN